MSGMDGALRDLLETAVGEPPHRVNVEAVHRRVVRRRVLEGIAGAAAVAALTVAIPVATVTAGHHPAAQRPQTLPARGPVAYVVNFHSGTVTPIAAVTGTPGKPIKDGAFPLAIAITPDRQTVYVASMDTPIATATNTPGMVTPVVAATGTPGRPIMVGFSPSVMATTPDGETLYVVNQNSGTVTPIATATNTPGMPIAIGRNPLAIAITPDGKTAYVVNTGSGTVTPISTATGTAGKPITVGNGPIAIAIG